MMGVYLHRRGRVWWVTVRHPSGARERWSLDTHERTVAAGLKRKYEERIARGEPARQPHGASSPSFLQFAELWLERKTGARRKSTLDGFRHVVAEVGKTHGHLPVLSFTRHHAREITDLLVRGGRGGRTGKTVLNLLGQLQSMFADVMEQLRDDQGNRRLAENPFANKAKLVEDRLDVSAAALLDPDEEPQPFSESELEALRTALGAWDARDRLKVLLGLEAGLRRSEVLALHRTDLDLEGAWTWVRRRLSRAEIGAPKTRRGRRRVPLSDALLGELRAHLRRQGLEHVQLFPARRKGSKTGYEDEKKFGARYLELLQAAGIDPGEKPFHRLRHTFCSRLLQAGVTPHLVSQWAGHGSTAFTESVYSEWLPGAAHREQINRPATPHGGDPQPQSSHNPATIEFSDRSGGDVTP